LDSKSKYSPFFEFEKKVNKNQKGITTEAYNKLKEFTKSHKHISLIQIKSFLSDSGFSYSGETIQKYIQQLKKEKIIYSAGRGYYSNIKNEFVVNYEDYQSLIIQIKGKYPRLTFSLWSTKMLAPVFHHLQNSFYTFIYADSDTLIFLRDFLLDNNHKVYLNPGKSELDKNVILQNNSIILRPKITRSKKENNISSIENILVDFYSENKKLKIVDISEYIKLFGNVINNHRIKISSILDYAERRKIDNLFKEFIIKYTNATFL